MFGFFRFSSAKRRHAQKKVLDSASEKGEDPGQANCLCRKDGGLTVSGVGKTRQPGLHDRICGEHFVTSKLCVSFHFQYQRNNLFEVVGVMSDRSDHRV